MTSFKSSAVQLGSPPSQEKSDTILKVEGVSKKFAYTLDTGRKSGVKRIWRELVGSNGRTETLEAGEFWALQDVSLELRRGEILGVVGRNGAGKSTLLKIINGIYLPDKGRVAIKGSTGGLIEIGAGLRPNLSGADNIYLVGSMLGMNKRQIDTLFDEIVHFADIGEFIDSPVQSYSSGMKVRLGFAIHIHQKLDLFLADEVLAVGDFDFQQKCLAKINEVRNDFAMILVSHSMPNIIRFCDRAIVIENAGIGFEGSPDAAVTHFTSAESKGNAAALCGKPLKDNPQPQGETGKEDESSKNLVFFPSGKRISKVVFGNDYSNESKIAEVTYSWRFGENEDGGVVEFGAQAQFKFSFRLMVSPKRLNIGFAILSTEGRLATGFYADIIERPIPISSEGIVTGTISVPSFRLNPGEYGVVLGIFDGTEYLFRKVIEPITIVRCKDTADAHLIYHGVYTETYSYDFQTWV
ncbi:polysaccharide ABC transporter ATP-binding protein [Thermodesulfobacteriota bacterium]